MTLPVTASAGVSPLSEFLSDSLSDPGATSLDARRWGGLRWPASAALLSIALFTWRFGMDGASSAQVLAHAAFCLGGGAPQAGVETLFGHCAACYASVSVGFAGLVLALWPKRGG